MRNRPGGHARLRLRQSRTESVTRNGAAWLGLLGLAVIVGVVVVILPVPTWITAYLLGFLSATTLATLGWVVFLLCGSYGASIGRLGEEATAEVVDTGRRRRRGWRIVNGLYFVGHGDVDHVLIGPGGVFVIESTWTSRRCSVDDGAVHGLLGREPIAQARDGARKIERLLRHGALGLPVEVRPVVVLWGPGRIRPDQGRQVVDGVLVCDGPRDEEWLPELEGSLLDQGIIDHITAFLSGQLSRQVDQPVPV